MYSLLKLRQYRHKLVAHRTSQKLAAKFYGPYLVLKKIGTVAYRLQLPPSATIHPVFHVSQLKKHVGNRKVQASLPSFSQEQTPQHRAVLNRRMIKKGHQAATQVLIHRDILSPADATWEFSEDLKCRFPTFSLEDKVELKRGALSGVATWRREEATVSQDWFINQTVRLSNYCAIRTV